MRLLLTLAALGSAKITVVPKEPKLIRGAGRSLILTCQGATNLEWIGPDGKLVSNTDRTVSPYVQRGARSLKLRISRLSPDAVGDYTCRSADDAEGGFAVRSIVIRQEVEFVSTPPVQQFLLGSEASVACSVVASGVNVTSEWFLPDGSATEPAVGPDAKDHVISKIGDDDAGIYTCVVSTGAGDVFEQEIEVEVEYRPEIVPLGESDFVKTVGERLDITCQASGNPLPATKWQRVNAEGSWVDFREGPQLNFEALTIENSGEYRCVAQNKHGKDEANLQVTIVPPPTIKFGDIEVEEPVMVVLGDMIELECSNEMVPFADFVWLLPDGSQVADAQLTVETARARDSGVYTCTATINKDMEIIETAKEVNLQVQFAPKPVSSERIIYSYPNLPTEIKCEFAANPLGNTTLVGDEETSVFGNSISRKFTPQVDDFPSNYTCISSNNIGEAEYELILKQAYTPLRVRMVEFTKVGSTEATVTFERDYTEGQIDIDTVIIKLKAGNRPLKVLRLNVRNRISFTLTELEAETEYSMTVQLKNIAGTSPESEAITFQTEAIAAPTIKINEIITRNGEYYVVWDLVQNGGGKLKKISLEYGQYENGSNNERMMRRTRQETHLPSGRSGELKLSDLEVNKQYWVLLTAHNERLSSRTAKVDFEPLNASENRLAIMVLCIVIGIILIAVSIDTGCYFTKRKGLLNALINARVNKKGARHLSSEHSSSEDDETQRELSPLNEKLPIDETDGGLVNVAEKEENS